VTQAYQQQEKLGFLEVDLLLLHNNRLVFLSDWKKLTAELKKGFPVGLISLLDEAAVATRQGMSLFLSFSLLLTPFFMPSSIPFSFSSPFLPPFLLI